MTSWLFYYCILIVITACLFMASFLKAGGKLAFTSLYTATGLFLLCSCPVIGLKEAPVSFCCKVLQICVHVLNHCLWSMTYSFSVSPVPLCITKAIKQIVICIRYNIPLIVMYITVNAVVIKRGERDCVSTVCYLLMMTIVINYW